MPVWFCGRVLRGSPLLDCVSLSGTPKETHPLLGAPQRGWVQPAALYPQSLKPGWNGTYAEVDVPGGRMSASENCLSLCKAAATSFKGDAGVSNMSHSVSLKRAVGPFDGTQQRSFHFGSGLPGPFLTWSRFFGTSLEATRDGKVLLLISNLPNSNASELCFIYNKFDTNCVLLFLLLSCWADPCFFNDAPLFVWS